MAMLSREIIFPAKRQRYWARRQRQQIDVTCWQWRSLPNRMFELVRVAGHERAHSAKSPAGEEDVRAPVDRTIDAASVGDNFRWIHHCKKHAHAR